MRRWIVALVGLFACGPQVALDDGETGNASGSGDGAALTTTEISADATSPGTAPVTSVGEAEAEVDVDDGSIIDDLGRHRGCGDGIDTHDEMCLVPGPMVPIGGAPIGVAAGDIDGDGIDEILVSEADGPAVLVARVSEGDVVIDPRELPSGTAVPVTVGDLDDDGRVDIAASMPSPSSTSADSSRCG